MNASSQEAYKVFDGIKNNNRDNGCWHATLGVPQWVQIQLTDKVKIEKFTVINRETDSQYESYVLKDFELQGSNDGENWENLGNYTNEKCSLNETEFTAQNTREYYYRWYITSSYSSYVSIGEIILDEAFISNKK